MFIYPHVFVFILYHLLYAAEINATDFFAAATLKDAVMFLHNRHAGNV